MKRLTIPLLALLVAGCGSFDPHRFGVDEFTFASWNIGHYALGKSCRSTIDKADAAVKSARYRAFLDEVDANILGIAEYSENFTSNDTTKAENAVFGRYRQHVIGPCHEYQWNAQFWNGRFISTKTVEYANRYQAVYYVATRMKITGRTVVFVETHLDWTHADRRKSQMQKLVDDFKDEPLVVIAGDFNIGIREIGKATLDNPAEYDIFADAGFTLGTDGRYKTFPAGRLDSSTACSLDNIIVKGLDILDFKVFDRPDLSDHALVRAKLRIRERTQKK